MCLLSADDYTHKYTYFPLFFLAIDIEAGTILNIDFCVNQYKLLPECEC